MLIKICLYDLEIKHAVGHIVGREREYYENEQLGALANSSFLSWQYIMQLENVIQNSNHNKYSSNS